MGTIVSKRVRNKVFGLSLALSLTGATIVSAKDSSSGAREVQFGKTSVVIPADVKPSSRWLALDALKVSVIPQGEDVAITASAILDKRYISDCRVWNTFYLVHSTIPQRSAHILFKNVTSHPTAFPNIQRLMGSLLELYEFTAPDLRNVWKEPITFYTSDIKTDVSIQLTEDLRISFVVLDRACFFQEGEKIVRDVIASVRAMLVTR